MTLALVAALSGACSAVSEGPAPDPTASLDQETFRCAVEPVLVRDCSFLACHGNPGLALRVYSIGKLRDPGVADDDIDIATLAGRAQLLTAGAACGQKSDEHHANFLSAAGLAFGGVAPEDNLLVRKPLPTEDGGYEHVGGAIFTGTGDPRVVAIRDWLAGKTRTCAPVTCPGGGP